MTSAQPESPGPNGTTGATPATAAVTAASSRSGTGGVRPAGSDPTNAASAGTGTGTGIAEGGAGTAPSAGIAGGEAGAVPTAGIAGSEAGAVPTAGIAGSEAGAVPTAGIAGSEAGAVPTAGIAGSGAATAPSAAVAGTEVPDGRSRAARRPEGVVLAMARPYLARLIGAGLLAAATELAGLALMATATWLLITAADMPPLPVLTVAIVSVRALAVGRGVLRYTERLASHDAVLRLLTDVRARVFGALAARRSPAPDAHSGDALSRLVSDVDAVQDLLIRVVVPAAAAAGVAVLALTGTVFIAPAATLPLAAGLLVAGLLLPVLAIALTRRTADRMAPLRGELAADAIDLTHGAADLAAFGATGDALAAASARAGELARLERRLALTGWAVDGAGVLVSGLTSAAVLITALRSGASGAEVGVLAVGTLAAVEATLALVAAARQWAQLRGALARVAELLAAPSLTDAPAGTHHTGTHHTAAGAHNSPAGTHNSSADTHNAPAGTHGDPAGTHDAPAGTHDASAGTHDAPAGAHDAAGTAAGAAFEASAARAEAGTAPVAADRAVAGPAPLHAARAEAEAEAEAVDGSRTGEAGATSHPVVTRSAGAPGADAERAGLELRDVVVRYRAGDAAALDGVDLRIRAGARIAIAGPSGAGKSTLLSVLIGAVTPESGTATLDGTAISAYPERDLPRHVGGLLAEAHVFHASVRENLLLGRDAPDPAEQAAAMRAADLLDWVGEQPDGWDTLVGEGGAKLSGGQRQRLALARALLAAPRHLLLDEPTEGLDPQAADRVLWQALDALPPGTSVLLVTHRLRGLSGFDEVLVLDRGRIIQRGRHDDLITRPGWYADTWLAQEAAERGYLAMTP
ncbi:ABC-type transport system involved in cytochrome bd biosynthesis fused ATPase/permease subunit [Catenuloplanes nepalensis]|uniref:ABC-type transport system involved in cytochrome bd biosynthesis fused ATPase/permease subunit n=1 Tax=Catenuloplanes nepalensis TaxID=587533 RepID=A0ABT9N2A1_9ACTN|nr:ATP-binding cassette domain-containing protein [Catenuloplanes nepalensis]MDP9797827.1 ABC-type transport system involved in cytochrome bd biosynthesis fused ATPase/permease subunit [Catenuloplanes nepalensis]